MRRPQSPPPTNSGGGPLIGQRPNRPAGDAHTNVHASDQLLVRQPGWAASWCMVR